MRSLLIPETFEVKRKIIRHQRRVMYLGRLYGNTTMATDRDLDGKIVILTINPRDIRTLSARMESGKKLGDLEIVDVKLSEPLSIDDARAAWRAAEKTQRTHWTKTTCTLQKKWVAKYWQKPGSIKLNTLTGNTGLQQSLLLPCSSAKPRYMKVMD